MPISAAKLISATVAFAIAGALFATDGQAGPNLLTNGSFEDITNFVNQGNDTMDLSVGSTLMPGWTVTGSHYLSWIGPTNPFGVTAIYGSYYLDLTGYIPGPPFSGVSQTIATNPGSVYQLSFALGSSSIWGLPSALEASAASASKVFTSTAIGSNNWETETLDFTANALTTTINLVGMTGVNYIGLDNVSVQLVSGPSVPEPASLVLLGFGTAVLGLARRRRSSDKL